MAPSSPFNPLKKRRRCIKEISMEKKLCTIFAFQQRALRMMYRKARRWKLQIVPAKECGISKHSIQDVCVCVSVWYGFFLRYNDASAFLSLPIRLPLGVCVSVCEWVWVCAAVCRHHRCRNISLFFFISAVVVVIVRLYPTGERNAKYTVCTSCCAGIHNILFVCRVSNCMCHLLFYNPTYRNPVSNFSFFRLWRTEERYRPPQHSIVVVVRFFFSSSSSQFCSSLSNGCFSFSAVCVECAFFSWCGIHNQIAII